MASWSEANLKCALKDGNLGFQEVPVVGFGITSLGNYGREATIFVYKKLI